MYFNYNYTLATDRVSRWFQAFRKDTPDGDRSLSVRFGVTREGRQSLPSTSFYQSRQTDTYVSWSRSFVSLPWSISLVMPEILYYEKRNFYFYFFIFFKYSFLCIPFHAEYIFYICIYIFFLMFWEKLKKMYIAVII